MTMAIDAILSATEILRSDWPNFNSIKNIDKANVKLWDAIKLIEEQLDQELIE